MKDPVMPVLSDATGFVVDKTSVLSNTTELALEGLAREIDSLPGGYQIGIAVFNNAYSETMELATKFGNANKLGSKEHDNGIAIVVLLEKKGSDGHKPAIGVAIGSGLEGLLNDAKVGRILDKTFVSLRKDGDWQEGLIETVKALQLVIKSEDGELYGPEPFNWVIWIIILILVIICLVVVSNGGTGSSGSSSSGSYSSSSFGGGGGFSGGGSSR